MLANGNRKPPSELLTVKQVSLRLNVHPNTVRRWAKQGVLNSYRVGPGGHRRFSHFDVERLLKSERPNGHRRTIPSPELIAVG